MCSCLQKGLAPIYNRRMTAEVINHLADHGVYHARELKGKRIPAFISSDLRGGSSARRLGRFENYLKANGAALVR